MITLLLGGARSGKSRLAEEIAGAEVAVTYVATTVVRDPEMEHRVRSHQDRRPAHWSTVEAGPGLAEVVASASGTVLVDSLTAWVAGSPDFAVDVETLCKVLDRRDGDAIIVSDEVGLGVHPSTPAGRRFRDALGLVNQAVASVADEVLLVVAGRTLRLSPASRDMHR